MSLSSAKNYALRAERSQDPKEAADLLLEIGVIKQIPDLSKLADTRFIQ